MNNKSAIAIIGGMGPGASGYLYKLLIDLAIKEFGAKNNDDFPEIILCSIPVPDFISNDKNRSKALEMLEQRVNLINNINVSCISVACNTAHVLLPQLLNVSKAPFVSMIDETVKQIKEDGKGKVGIMGTPLTIKYRLYQSALTKQGIEALVPNVKQLHNLEKIIRSILCGKILPEDKRNLVLIANSLKTKGAQGIILGCTELPLVFPKKYSLPVYNSVEILAMALLKRYYAKANK